MILRFLAVTALLWSVAAAGQPADRELASLRNDFTYGKYDDVLARAKERIDRGQLTEEQLVELHKMAGLSAQYLGRSAEAEQHFSGLLRIDPDYSLDPFVVPPTAVAFFEKIRRQLGQELDVVRERRRMITELAERERKQREQSAREAEEMRRRLEELPRRTVVRTVRERSFIANFLPFGAGQLLQDRSGLGVTLAVTEGVTAATSLVAYIALGTLFERRVRTIDGEEVTESGIPLTRQSEALNWRATMVISGALFYALYVYGVLDAIYHHDDQVVTESVQEPTPSTSLGQRLAPPRLSPFVFSTGQATGGGLTVNF